MPDEIKNIKTTEMYVHIVNTYMLDDILEKEI